MKFSVKCVDLSKPYHLPFPFFCNSENSSKIMPKVSLLFLDLSKRIPYLLLELEVIYERKKNNESIILKDDIC